MNLNQEERQAITVPLLSIGMPAYNGAKYISEALNSLLSQTFTDFELIISDNASTDDTGAICARYAASEPRIRYIRQGENCGAFNNFEFLLKEARGEYFMWAACDDFEASQDYLTNLISVMREGGYGVVIPAIDIISTSVDGTTQYVTRKTMDRFIKCRTPEDYCVTSVCVGAFHMYGMFRRIALLENFPYVRRAQDVMGAFCDSYFAQVFSQRASVCYVSDARKVYRQHGTSEYATAFSPVGYLVRYMRYCRLCLRFWLGESGASLRTQARILTALFYWNGRHTLRLLYSSAVYMLFQASSNVRGDGARQS